MKIYSDRTANNIKDDVLKKALKLTGIKKKVDVVNLAIGKHLSEKRWTGHSISGET